MMTSPSRVKGCTILVLVRHAPTTLEQGAQETGLCHSCRNTIIVLIPQPILKIKVTWPGILSFTDVLCFRIQNIKLGVVVDAEKNILVVNFKILKRGGGSPGVVEVCFDVPSHLPYVFVRRIVNNIHIVNTAC